MKRHVETAVKPMEVIVSGIDFLASLELQLSPNHSCRHWAQMPAAQHAIPKAFSPGGCEALAGLLLSTTLGLRIVHVLF